MCVGEGVAARHRSVSGPVRRDTARGQHGVQQHENGADDGCGASHRREAECHHLHHSQAAQRFPESGTGDGHGGRGLLLISSVWCKWPLHAPTEC